MHFIMKPTITFIITLSFFSFHCQNGNSEKLEVKNNAKDSVIWDIPEWYSTSMFSQKRDRKLRTLLKLDSLKDGFDSLQIRIWMDCGDDLGRLILLERQKNRWNSVFYSYQTVYDEKLDVEIRNLKKESKSPKSGWGNFSENLMKTDITKLPDHSKFSPKYNLPNHANRVLVEIGTSRDYRLYVYPELGMNSEIAEGPGKLHRALKLIEREFNYSRPCQDSTGAK
jgi:hypothetical protein